MKHKKLFISLTAVISVLIFFAIFLMIWFFGDTYEDFENFNQEFEIPGLEDGAIPQGMTACTGEYTVLNEEGLNEGKTQRYFFISAYMKDGSPSRIYVVGSTTGYEGYVTLKGIDGGDFYGHCGGIAINNKTGSVLTETSCQYYTLWVTGESYVYCAKPSEEYVEAKKTIAQEIIAKAPEHGSIQFTASFNANCNASFCFYFDDPRYTGTTYDRLYVGEFYRKGNYETDALHRVVTPSGYQNTAFMYEYKVSADSSSGTGSDSIYGLVRLSDGSSTVSHSDFNIDVPKIQSIYSLPEMVQGVAWAGRNGYATNDGTLVLSQSYGLSNSHLLCFDYSKVTANDNKTYFKELTEKSNSFEYEGIVLKTGGNEIKYTDPDLYVYFVDKGNDEMLIRDYSIPSMSEGMCLFTPYASNSGSPIEKIYVLFESGSKKYRMFVRRKLKNVYSFTIHL